MADHFEPGHVLEIGVGAGLTTDLLRKEGFTVTTLDIDPELKPDRTGSILNIPAETNEFDYVVCCQVLEHLPYESSEAALHEIQRVCKIGALISLPTVRRLLTMSLYGAQTWWHLLLPLIQIIPGRPRNRIEHYWELEAGVTEREFKASLNRAGWKLVADTRIREYHYHHFFVVRTVA